MVCYNDKVYSYDTHGHLRAFTEPVEELREILKSVNGRAVLQEHHSTSISNDIVSTVSLHFITADMITNFSSRDVLEQRLSRELPKF